ncbi:MAG: TerC family protein [Cytophagales bacterium]|nr:TerC family protein [Cytophagales bacterium]MDW8383954.1 TerC family protein [Flammeovirgaceae bacterium]
MEQLFNYEAIVSLFTLALLEIVLGIDNVIFISIICGKVAPQEREKARRIGILLALFVRISLLTGIQWLTTLTEPIFTLLQIEFSWKSIILLAGGLFLIYKSVREIHDKLEGDNENEILLKNMRLAEAIIQIIMIDIVFSFDSILTAVGLSRQIVIMIIAVIIAMIMMLIYAKKIGDFVDEHPTVKMLALAFLVMIGFLLITESFGKHIEKGYVYFAMLFALSVELMNMKMTKNKRKRLIKHE